MTKVAWVFPGQGSQAVGMGKDIYDEYPQAREVFDLADEALGFSLSRVIFEGPEETHADRVRSTGTAHRECGMCSGVEMKA